MGAVSSRTPQWGKVRSGVIGDINQQIRSQLRSSAPVSEKRRISACVRPVKNKRRGGHTINQSKRLEKKRCERIKKATSGGMDFDARHSCQLFCTGVESFARQCFDFVYFWTLFNPLKMNNISRNKGLPSNLKGEQRSPNRCSSCYGIYRWPPLHLSIVTFQFSHTCLSSSKI